jgi:uncharacterized protein DUF6544
MLTIFLWTVAILVILALAYLTWQRAVERGRWARARALLAAGPHRERIFSETQLAGLPPPARRYLARALPAGVPLASAVEVALEQRVKADKTQLDSPFHVYPLKLVLAAGRGMVVSGRMKASIPRSVLFWYAEGAGRGREALFDLVPVLLSAGENVARTLRGRALYELFFLPSALLPQSGATWEGIDEERARVAVTLDGEAMTLTLRIAPDGRLLEVTAPRWGSTGTADGGFTHIPFGMVVEEDGTFDGYTIPTRLRGGWWYGTERYIESIRLLASGARFAAVASVQIRELEPALNPL